MNSFLPTEQFELLKRVCVLVLFLAFTSCGGNSAPVINANKTGKQPFAELPITEKSLVGKWDIINKLDPGEVERLTKIKTALFV